jgi:hypothetical protein
LFERGGYAISQYSWRNDATPPHGKQGASVRLQACQRNWGRLLVNAASSGQIVLSAAIRRRQLLPEWQAWLC